MSAPQVLMVVASAMVVIPIVVVVVLIAVEPAAHPRYARTSTGIDDRSPSALRPTHRESPEPSVVAVTSTTVTPVVRVDLGHQALRDAVGSRAGRGAEVFG